VESITYDVQAGVRDRGQRAMIVTERAVFDVTAEGLVLTEIAPGIDLDRDILGQMEFPLAGISETLRDMDPGLFLDPTRLDLAG